MYIERENERREKERRVCRCAGVGFGINRCAPPPKPPARTPLRHRSLTARPCWSCVSQAYLVLLRLHMLDAAIVYGKS